jgi:hypothetical protein
LRNAAGALVTANVAYNAANNTATLTPASDLANSTTYTVVVTGGASGVKDLAGNALAADATASFTTAAEDEPAPGPEPQLSSLWNGSATPGTVDSGDTDPLEVGVRFSSATSGYITGIRYYKAAANNGTHIGNLWSSSGQLLATATFTNETASGWQQVNFATPVAVTAGAMYTASYHSNAGRYSYNRNYFGSQFSSGSLSVPTNGGVYRYGTTSAFPSASYQGSNYWIDVVLSTAAPADTTPPTVTAFSPSGGSSNVAVNSTMTVTFNEAMNASTINTSTVFLRNAAGAVVATTVSYNATNRTATLTPASVLANSSTYTIVVQGGASGVKDAAANALAGTATSSFTTTAAADTTPPTVTAFSPSGGSSNVAVNSAMTVTFNEAMNASTISTSTVFVRNAAGVVAAANVSYNASTRTATVTPSAALANSTTYTIVVRGGASGVKDSAGNALVADATSSFTTAAQTPVPGATTSSLWSTSATPGTIDSGDTQAVELGVRFSSTTAGYITGIRFYKAAANSGTHIGNLWSSSGQLLATGTFTGETTSGWQTLTFASPVAVTAGTTYVASYHTTSGHYAFNRNYFNSQFTSGNLRVPANGGVYRYGTASAFPSSSYQGSNYWVDVLLTTTPPVDTTPPTVSGISPAAGSTNVTTTAAATVTFSETLDASTVNANTVFLRNAAGTVIPSTLTYNAASRTVTLTPSGALANSTSYTIVVKGGAAGIKDAAGNALAADVTSSFTTASNTPPVGTPTSLWSTSTTPGTVDSGDTDPVELGVRFSSTTNGFITGVRFYKSAANTGPHTGSLWSSSGQLLATGTFTGETASGWQTLTFASPVAITAGTTYVASYHTTSGHYSFNRNFFASQFTSGSLRVPANGGVYRYGNSSAFPSASYQGSNYWVDVVFVPEG